MQQIAIQPVPSQQLQTVLDGQNCQIAVYQTAFGLFVDLNADGTEIFIASLARDAVMLNPRTYMSFNGNLVFIDNQGNNDPTYDGLGSRYQLVYLTADEYAQFLQSQNA